VSKRSIVGLAGVAMVALVAVTSAQSKPAATTINIGWVGDKSGPTASSQLPALQALEAFFKQVNAAGGINGAQINLIEKDDVYNPVNTLSLIKSLISDDHVPLILGLGQSSAFDSWLPVINSTNTIGYMTQAALLGANNPFQKNVFSGNCSLADQVDVGIAYLLKRLRLKNLKGKSVGDVYIDVASGAEWRDDVSQAVSRLGGTAVHEPIPATALNADVQVQDLQSKKVDFVMLHNGTSGGITVLKSMEKYGFAVPIVGSFGVTNDLVFTNSPYSISKLFFGTNCTTPPSLAKSALSKTALAAGAKYGYPAANVDNFNYSTGWIQAMVVVQALKAAKGNYTADAIRKGLETVKNLDTGGLSPKVTLSSNCHLSLIGARPYTYNYQLKSMQQIGSFEQWLPYVTKGTAAPGTCGKK
jgi:branched-chain amino acid transport system substrate-binding protein